MPAKWQQWMPFYIEAFLSSSSVQAMAPAARLGYICLLLRSWQSEDCTISSDPLALAEDSTLGDKQWAIHGPRILRKFDSVGESGRLRNAACYDRWLEAKRVFESRKQAAQKTNAARSAHGDRNGSVAHEERSADTRTTVVPVDVSVPISVNGDSGSELTLANWLFEELGIATDNSTRQIAADAVRLVAKEGGTTRTAAEFILHAARDALAAGEVVNRFWFTDRRYAGQKAKKTSRQRRIDEWRPADETG